MKRYELLDELEELQDYADENNIGSNEAELEYRELVANLIEKLLKNNGILIDVTKRNWFERMPLWFRLLYYMVGGILIGLMLPYVW
jgi:hypothetical protein